MAVGMSISLTILASQVCRALLVASLELHDATKSSELLNIPSCFLNGPGVIPKKRTRSSMLTALRPFIRRGSAAPGTQFPSFGSKISVESNSPEVVIPPLTR